MRILFMIAGALGVLDTIVVRSLSNMNLGIALPAILGAPLLLVGIFYTPLSDWAARGGLGAWCKWAFIGGYAILTLLFFVTASLIGVAAGKSAPPKADALIVLGAGLRGERPTRVLERRLNTALTYLKENPETLVVVSGGMGSGETVTEAHAMARYLTEKGLEPHRIIKEERSKSTEENFAFSAALIRERLGEGVCIAFVTTDFHVYRAGRVAAKQDVAAAGIPAPDVWYIRPNNILRECVAIWMYWLTGKI